MTDFDFKTFGKDLTNALGGFAAKIGTTDYFQAKLGRGDGSNTICDRNNRYARAVFYYAALSQDRSAGTAILPDYMTWADNPNYLGLPVTIGKQAGDDAYRVLGVGGLAGNQMQGNQSMMEAAINNAGYPTLDRIANLRVYSTSPSSLNVAISGEFFYVKPSDGTPHVFTPAPSLIIAPTIASAVAALSGGGKHQLAVVCLDPEAGTLKLVTGTAVTPTGALGSSEAHDEFTSADAVALATGLYVATDPIELWDGQTTVEETAFYRAFDLRGMFAPIQAYVAGQSSSTDNDFMMFSGTNGRYAKDNGTSLSTDGTLSGNSNSLVPSQAAVKAYVDATIAGKSAKDSVVLASAAALPTNVYVNGVSGVGATLTGTATGVLTIDGVAVTAGMRLLIKDEVAQANNGIYVCTVAGAGGVAYVLTRTTDSNTSAEIIGSFMFAEQGTANADKGFVNTNTSAITIGATAITYAAFSGGGNVSGPGSSTDRAIATWNGTGGTALRDNANATVDSGGGLKVASVLVGTALDASAIAEFDSTTKGLLIPVMTSTQRNAISSPASGLLVYDTTVPALYQYQGGAWVALGTAGAGSLTIGDGTHSVANATSETFVGATVSGTTPNATVTIPSSIWGKIYAANFTR